MHNSPPGPNAFSPQGPLVPKPDHTTAIVYEHSLNERLRFFLRLEFLFRQARHSQRGEAVWDSHNTLTTLLDIVSIITRVDIKTEVIKELDRIHATLTVLTQTPGIKHDTLDQLLTTLGGFKSQLYSMEGALAQNLRESELFKLLNQRGGIPGGLCDVDLPLYRHWLKRPAENRITELKSWLSSLDSLRLSVELILKLVRESAEPQARTANSGNYQQSLDTATSFQMIRVFLPADSPFFIEISGGRHRFCARFMLASATARPTQTEQDVDFQLSCCAL